MGPVHVHVCLDPTPKKCTGRGDGLVWIPDVCLLSTIILNVLLLCCEVVLTVVLISTAHRQHCTLISSDLLLVPYTINMVLGSEHAVAGRATGGALV